MILDVSYGFELDDAIFDFLILIYVSIFYKHLVIPQTMASHLPPQSQGLHPTPLYAQEQYTQEPPPMYTDSQASGYEYILYVHPEDANSIRAVKRVQWGPGELSVDGLIRYQNIKLLKHHLPTWLTHVPTLGHVPTKTKWTGSACLEKLRDIRETAEDRETTSDPLLKTRGAVGSAEILEPNKPFVLPPDPRDVLNASRRPQNPEVVRPMVPPTPQHLQQPVDMEVRDVVLEYQRPIQSNTDTQIIRAHVPRNPRTPTMAPEDELDGPICDDETGVCRVTF